MRTFPYCSGEVAESAAMGIGGRVGKSSRLSMNFPKEGLMEQREAHRT